MISQTALEISFKVQLTVLALAEPVSKCTWTLMMEMLLQLGDENNSTNMWDLQDCIFLHKDTYIKCYEQICWIFWAVYLCNKVVRFYFSVYLTKKQHYLLMDSLHDLLMVSSIHSALKTATASGSFPLLTSVHFAFPTILPPHHLSDMKNSYSEPSKQNISVIKFEKWTTH